MSFNDSFKTDNFNFVYIKVKYCFLLEGNETKLRIGRLKVLWQITSEAQSYHQASFA